MIGHCPSGRATHEPGLASRPGHSVSVPNAAPSLECRTIRNGFYWAHIFVQEGCGKLNDGSPRHWANVAILSDFGTFGYCWTHMGEPWPEFCRDLDFHYAMGKLAGRHFYEPLDIDECRIKTREIVLERRRTDCMTKEDARALWDALLDCCEASTFLADLDRLSDGAMYREELWDARWEQPSASARGFWSEIWPHYLAAIATEAGTAETTKIGSVHEGAGLKGIAQKESPNDIPTSK